MTKKIKGIQPNHITHLKAFFFSLFLTGSVFAFAQKIQLVNRATQDSIAIRTKRIKSIISMDGMFYEGKAKVSADGVKIGQSLLKFEEIGILEVKKGNTRKVLGFPLKAVGIGAMAIGGLFTAAFFDNDDSETNLALGAAGVTLLGAGAGATFLSKKVTTNSSDSSVKTYHTKDWAFSLWYKPPTY